MFAKGPISGFSPKSEALKLCPNAVCRKKATCCGITGYVIYVKGKGVCSASTAKEAWEKFWYKLISKE